MSLTLTLTPIAEAIDAEYGLNGNPPAYVRAYNAELAAIKALAFDAALAQSLREQAAEAKRRADEWLHELKASVDGVSPTKPVPFDREAIERVRVAMQKAPGAGDAAR